MSRGKRYEGEQKLNLKKVFAVIIAIAVIIMFIIGIKHLFNTKSTTEEKTVALKYFPIIQSLYLYVHMTWIMKKAHIKQKL